MCQCHTVLITVALKYSLSIGSLISPALVSFFKIALANLDLLCFHTNCKKKKNCANSVKNAVGILIRIVLNLWIPLDSIITFTILILPIQEHGISLVG